MSSRQRWTDEAGDRALEQALGDFRQSVQAWSEAEYRRPWTTQAGQAGQVGVVPRHGSWRLAAGWALGCVLAAASLTGGLYQRHERREAAKIAAMHRAEEQRLAAKAQRTRAADESLLATVDSDVSREVPSAMEPLAQLMEEGTNQ